MAKTKPKPDTEPTRKPGRPRFTLPRHETPPIDGSYLTNLFADFQGKSIAANGLSALSGTLTPSPQGPETAAVAPGAAASAAPTDTDKAQPPTVATSQAVLPVALNEGKSSKKPTRPKKSARLSETTAEPSHAEPKPIAPPNDQFAVQGKSVATKSERFAGYDEPLARLGQQFRLTKSELAVLQLLRDLARDNDTGDCYLKVPHLAETTQLSHRQIQRILRQLEMMGLIEKIADYSNADRLGMLFRLVPALA